MDYELIGANFLQGLGVLAIAVALTELVWKNTQQGLGQNTLVAVVFSIGVAGTMSVPFQLQEGFIFDLRHVFLVLAGVIGGIPTMIATFVTAIGVRIIEGGAGSMSGMVGITIAAVLGLVYYAYFKVNDLSTRILISMGAISSLHLAAAVVLPFEVAIYVLVNVGPSLLLINFLGITLAGKQLSTARQMLDKHYDLETESKTDLLTGLPNRRSFETNARHAAEEAISAKGSYALFVLDIDNFKTVNDTFGHASGDKVIQNIGQVLSHNSPLNGELGRFGGEEFVLLVPNLTEENATIIAELVRTSVQAEPHSVKGMNIGVTVSVGFCVVGTPDVTWEEAFELADQALYQAKHNGRNCTISSKQVLEGVLQITKPVVPLSKLNYGLHLKKLKSA